MISFDITDKEAKILTGTSKGGRIRVMRAVSCGIKQGSILDGVIYDVAAVATDLHEAMKQKSIDERTAVVTITSSQIVFKELYVPKAKKEHFNTMVNNQIYNTMGISDEYNVTYTVVSESVSEDGVTTVKVLVTACPQKLVDSYKQLFSMLGIRLKAVYINSSSITRLLLANEKAKLSMPLLSVQLDSAFISINLYEGNQLSFSRHVGVDSGEVSDNQGYVSSAASENILRMIQFHSSKRGVKPIENIILFGEPNDFNAVSSYASLLGLNAHILEPPKSMSAFEGFDFVLFANAVGALIKAEEKRDQTNLLNSLSDRRQKKQTEYVFAVGGTALASIVILVLAFALMQLQISDINKDISRMQAQLNSPELVDELAMIDIKSKILKEYEEYAEHARAARGAFSSKPKLSLDIFSELERYLGTEIAILNITKEDEMLIVNLVAKNQDLPALYAKKLIERGYFDSISYSGFNDSADGVSGTRTSDNEILSPGSYGQGQVLSDDFTVKFTIVAFIKGGDAQ